MTTAPDIDPYLLPLPTPASPVVLPHLVRPLHAHLNGRYADPVWPLAALTENPSTSKIAIRWAAWPASLQDEMRLAAWNLINGQLRPTFMQGHGSRMRSRLSLSDTYNTLKQWKQFARWLEARGSFSLGECSPSVLHDYGQHLRDTAHNRGLVLKSLVALARLWAFDQLSARPSGIGRPPWDELGVDDYLPSAATTGGENVTEPLAEQTIGPLLIWAMRMVDDLSEDILTGWAERQRLTRAARTSFATPAGLAALRAYLEPMIAGHALFPAVFAHGKPAIARTYLGGITGASRNQVGQFIISEGLTAATAQHPGPCPLNIPVTGQIAGKPWRTALDFREAPVLMRHLGTAAFVVCAYLTGMRPGEVLGLRTGCCPEPASGQDGQPGHYLIRGREFKTAIDDDGNHLSGGTEREVPWVAITPVVNAIRVLERMVPAGHLLFDHHAHDLLSRPGTGSLKVSALRDRIKDFVTWANREAARHGLANEIIPPDPHGNIAPKRFRRTLAWYIARRPNGLVALAVQYGHMRAAFDWITERYGSRGRGGIHDLIDLETARAVADTVAALHDDLENGGGVSGPAARRAIKAAATAPRFVGTVITLASARRLVANEDAMLYDNPHALLLCHYKRDRALCHRAGVKDTPSLDHCVPGCGNIARTDQQAAHLRERALILESQAARVPQPIGDRLRANAARLRGLADKHDRTRITAKNHAG
jgi:integrase